MSKDTINIRLFSWQYLGLKKDLDHSDGLMAVRAGSSSVGSSNRASGTSGCMCSTWTPGPPSAHMSRQGSRFTCSEP